MNTSVEAGANYKITPISPVLAKSYWPHVVVYVRKALVRTGLAITPLDVFDRVVKNRAQFWLVHEPDGYATGVVITEIIQYGVNAKVCRIWIAAGENFSGWRHNAQTRIYAWAKENNVHSLETIGRLGFQRKHAATEGWKCVAAVYRKEI